MRSVKVLALKPIFPDVPGLCVRSIDLLLLTTRRAWEVARTPLSSLCFLEFVTLTLTSPVQQFVLFLTLASWAGMKSGTFEKTRINAVCNTLSGHEVAINCAMGLGIRKALL